jgi:transcriptional regulator with XRE-family HTH domain
MEQFGARLQELRLARGWSQEDLAVKASVPVWSIRNWERGKHELGWGSVVALAEALGVSTEAFREAAAAPRRKWASGRPRKPQPAAKGPPLEVRCPGCEQAFTTQYTDKRYCSSACRWRMRQRRKADRAKAAVRSCDT